MSATINLPVDAEVIDGLYLHDFVNAQSTDEIIALLQEADPDMSLDEVEEYLDTIKANLADLGNQLQDIQNGDEDALKEAQESGDVAAEAAAELKMQDTDAAVELLEEIEDAAEDFIEHKSDTCFESVGDATVNVADLYDGEVVNVTLGADFYLNTEVGTKVSLMGSSGNVTTLKTTRSDGQVNIINITDNGTGISTTESALGLNEDDADELSDKNGDTFLTYEDSKEDAAAGGFRIIVQGADCLDPSEVESWPDEISKIVFDNDSTVSVYDQLREENMTDLEKAQVSPGFNDTLNSLSTNSEMYGLNVDTVDYQTNLELLWTWLDDTSASKGAITSIPLVGLTPDMVTALVLGIMQNNEQQYTQTLLAPLVSQFETVLGFTTTNPTTDDFSANAKMTVMLLELQSGGAGIFGGDGSSGTIDPATGMPLSFWTTAMGSEIATAAGTYSSGSLTNHDTNKTAITQYQSAVAGIDWQIETGQSSLALTGEEWLAANDVNYEEANTGYSSPKEEWLAFDFADSTYKPYGSDTTKAGWEVYINSISTKMFDESGQLKTGQDLYTAIYPDLSKKEIQDNDIDNLLTQLIYVVVNYASPGFAQQFMNALEPVADKIIDDIQNGGADPQHMSEMIEYLLGTRTVES